MAAAFQKSIAFAQKSANAVADINPLNKVFARVDAGGNALGVYGDKAPTPYLGDPLMRGTGLYGNDATEYNASMMNNARIKAIQEGDTDLAAVNQRTSAMLAGQNQRTTLNDLLGG